MHKKRHRPARRALVVGRRGSGDVEVHPSCAASRDGFRGPLGGARFPERFEAEMVCETKGKTMETVRIDDVFGNHTRPPGADAVLAKFRANAARSLKKDGVGALQRAALELVSARDLKALSAALRQTN
jgi:hypothetical protein